MENALEGKLLGLSEEELDLLCELLQDDPYRPKEEILHTDQRATIASTFWILDTKRSRRIRSEHFGEKNEMRLAFSRWVKGGAFERLLDKVDSMVEKRGGYKLYACFVDRSFSRAKNGGDNWQRKPARKPTG